MEVDSGKDLIFATQIDVVIESSMASRVVYLWRN